MKIHFKKKKSETMMKRDDLCAFFACISMLSHSLFHIFNFESYKNIPILLEKIITHNTLTCFNIFSPSTFIFCFRSALFNLFLMIINSFFFLFFYLTSHQNDKFSCLTFSNKLFYLKWRHVMNDQKTSNNVDFF